MAYMRDQHKTTPYVTDYAHGGYGLHSDQSVVQPPANQLPGWGSSGDQSIIQPQANQLSGWGSSGDQSVVQPPTNQPSGWGSSSAPTGGMAWQRGYGGNDYNYENGGKEPQRDYQQTERAGYVSGGFIESYESSCPGGDGRTGRQLHNSERGGQLQDSERGGGGGGGMQWLGEGRGGSGTQWQGQEKDDSGMHWQGLGRGSLRDNVDSHWPGQGRETSGTQGGGDSGLHWQGKGRGDGGFQRQDQGTGGSGLLWQGQGRGDDGFQQKDQGGGDRGLLWQGQGRGDGGFQRQDQGRGDSGLHWQGQGRGDGGLQWQDQGKERSGTQLGRVDDGGLLWQGQGRGDGGFQLQDQGKERSGTELGQDDSGLHRQGQGRDESGIHWQGKGRVNSDIHWEGPGRGNSDICWENQERGNSDIRWEGPRRGNIDIHQESQGRGNSDIPWEGPGRGSRDIHWESQGRGNGDIRWEGSGRDNSDIRRGSRGRGNSDIRWDSPGRGNGDIHQESQGRGNSDIRWEGPGRGNSDIHWESQGRGNSDIRWEGPGRGNSDIRREGQGRGNSDIRWDGPGRGNRDIRRESQGRDNSDIRWEGQGRDNSDIRWEGQGRGNRDIRREGQRRGNRDSQWQDQGEDNDSQWLGRGGGQGGRELGRDGGRGRGGSELGRGEGLGGSELGMGGGGSELEMDSSGDLDGSESWMVRRRRGKGGDRNKYKLRKLLRGSADEAPEQGNDNEKPSEGSETSLAALLRQWQEFAKEFANHGNAVSNMECSLTASKVSFLKLECDCKFLALCGNNNIFTTALKVYRLDSEYNVTEDFAFLARCQGLNKKTAKRYCYDKAFNTLMNSSVEEIMSQQEISEATAKQQVQQEFKKNPKEFLALLKGDTVSNLEEDKKEPDNKRSASIEAAEPAPKRSKQADLIMAMILRDNWSLAASKRIEAVDPSDPLVMKLQMLKQLLKEEGITKLHIVPKIDQLSYKATIHIQNVYRFEDAPVAGFKVRTTTPVYCEIYFDGVYMSRGDPDVQKHVALQHAYSNLASLLFSKPLNVLADNPRKWVPYMALDADVHTVVTKHPGKDNDSYVDSNLFDMKQIMQSVPDIKVPMEQMVLVEQETDENMHNKFAFLKLNATRNLMFLECEILKNPDLTFTCTISVQGKILATQVDSTDKGAKQLCSETAVNDLKKTQNIIHVKTEYTGRTITKSELLSNATKMKEQGKPPAKIFKRLADHKKDTAKERDKKGDQGKLPEDVTAEPLLPWIAAAVYEILDEYYQKITLEDLIVDLEGMPKSQQDIVASCAAKMGLRMETKSKTSSKNSCVLIRTMTGQDMDKILQLNGGESGRYKLVSCKNSLSKEQLEKFRNQCLEQHKKLVEARTKDNPDEHPEPSSALGSQPDKSDDAWQSKYIPTERLSRRSPSPFRHRSRRESPMREHRFSGVRPRMNPYPYGRYPFNRY